MKEIIEAMEYYAKIHRVPIMEPDGIAFVKEYIKEHQCKTILEIGSAIGYSAIQMASVDEEIQIITLEKDEERYLRAIDNVLACKLQDRVTVILMDALEYEPQQSFDLIFIDAAKAKYQRFFDHFHGYLHADGTILTDNMNFHGLVADSSSVQNRSTRKMLERLQEYHTFLFQHRWFDTTLVQIGDGIAISKRKPLLVDGVIFDMDGLMIDSERMFLQKSREWNKDGLLLNLDAFMNRAIGRNSRLIASMFVEEYGTAIPYQEFDEAVGALVRQEFQKSGVPHKTGLLVLLELLKKAGLKLAVATSTSRSLALEHLTMAGIMEYFDVIITGDMVANSKPHPEIFLTAAKALGIEPGRTLVLEDSNSGVQGAISGGFGVMMIVDILPPANENKEQLMAIGFSLHEVIPFIEQSIGA